MLVMFHFSSFFRSRIPLEADYDISKVQNSLEADRYFKGPELFRGRPVQNSLEADQYFEVWNSLEADQYFEGLKLFRGRPVFRRSERSGLSLVISKVARFLRRTRLRIVTGLLGRTGFENIS
ncbi:hypothetical protein RclHR1_02540015 [Rhizophagus clarus]|uniref:Uncharacterized protein n=1 Tax=Rhizophagus clarus TaxID=94130 RepID=A0A2Z6REV5_9GLOM|nr:hypothetical protein RclHR1_02540015 [Rhizophagus clarus]